MNKDLKNYFRKIIFTNRGFTLVELAISLVIFGVILASLSTAITLTRKKSIQIKNNEIVTAVQTEIERFLEIQGRYPCPADASIQIDTANFGIEANEIPPTPVECADVTAGDGVYIATAGAKNVIIGAVPVRSLNLPDEFVFDAYQTRLLYAVTVDLTDSETYDREGGVISINDTSGNASFIPVDEAPFAIVTFGENPQGVHDGASGQVVGNCIDLATAEEENCDNDTIFVSSLLASTNPTNFYDDYVVSRNGNISDRTVPAGAVLYFNLAECPKGWQEPGTSLLGTPPGTMVECAKL